jgi:2-keto-4-pentenoate hydratase
MPQLSVFYPAAMLADGYAIQRVFVTRMLEGDGVGGFKAAVVAETGQARLGIDEPVTAIMPASGVLAATDKVVIDLAKDNNRYIETEIGYVFGRAITEPLKDIDALKQYIDAVVPVIEVPGGVTENTQPSTAADLAAWNSNAKQMIVGPQYNPALIAVDDETVSLTHNEKAVNTGTGREAAGGQWATLLKTVNNLVRRGYTVQPGHMITNGALGKALKAEVGQYQAAYGKLGTITFEVRDSKSGR